MDELVARFGLLPLTGALAITLALGGCASAPKPAPEPAPKPTPPAPAELNIPLPATEEGCDCTEVTAATENYFDRGVRALAARDYERARVYFERHRGSDEPQAIREADVGIAFVTLLSQSGDAVGDDAGASGVDERAEVMILALAAIQSLESQLSTLQQLNDALSGDLRKREEALKRLRDLTLGQPEGAR
jgi:hypothetical protein